MIQRKLPTVGGALGLALMLAACGGGAQYLSEERIIEGESTPAPPTGDYRSDILAYLRVYLNDPTGVRDAAIAEPVLQPFRRGSRYVVCLRFNARKSDGTYMGGKEYLAVFQRGRFDQLSTQVREECAGATWRPFPELEALKR